MTVATNIARSFDVGNLLTERVFVFNRNYSRVHKDVIYERSSRRARISQHGDRNWDRIIAETRNTVTLHEAIQLDKYLAIVLVQPFGLI